MKSLVYILLFFSQMLFAQGAFEKGNSLYSQKKYAEAVKAYESVIQGGEESPEIYFNLGNANYQLKKVGPAIYNYEKSLQLDPGNDEVLINLGFAQKLAVDDIKVVPATGVSKILYNWAGNFHYDSWAWTAVVCAFISVLLFGGYYFVAKPEAKQAFFGGMIISLLFMALSIVFAFFVRSEAQSERPAIVFAKTVPLQEAPEADAAKTFILHEGTKVHVVQESGSRIKVELADATTGWIAKDAVKELR